MKTNTLKWYFERLKAMSAKELAWRLNFSIKKEIWKIIPPKYPVKPNLKNLGKPKFAEFLIDKSDSEIVIKEADQYLEGKWLFFGLKNCKEKIIDWHKDPISEISAPRLFSFEINHRDESIVGNIKNTWEKNRHHHLTVLAVAYFLTKDERYSKEIYKQLLSWIDSNPYLIGVNWTHPLEQGVRLISWVYIYNLLSDSKYFEKLFGPKGKIWKSIYEHQKFIEMTYSRGSSANNHLIGEMAGLFISSCVWPIFSESDKWKGLSKRILEQELANQNYSDGINKELAFSYQIFVTQFALLCLMEDNNFSKQFKDIVTELISFTSKINSILGSTPNYGDGDEGMALQLNSRESKQYPWIYASAKKFLNVDLRDIGFSKNAQYIVSKQAGIVSVSKKIKNNSVGLIFDCGPLGMGSMAAHGHSDALSFVMTVNGLEFLIDPGTYCYHDDLKWRRYFRSTKAHNTITIDQLDQSEQLGPFLWGNKYDSFLEEFNHKEFRISAWHNGYRFLGITHKRSLFVENSSLKIMDEVLGNGTHSIQIRFHLHPNVECKRNQNSFILEQNSIAIKLDFQNNFKHRVIEGDEDGGWYSPQFGIKMKSKTIVLEQVLSLPTQINTIFKFL